MSSGIRTTVDLVAGHSSSGDAVREEVLVDRHAGGDYRIVATPGLVLGIAADDVIRVGRDGTYTIVSRGGNLAVQLHGPHPIADALRPDVERLGGRLDSRARDLTVFTIPVTAGFAAVERMLNGFTAEHPGTEWYFGNVYDPGDGVTPLGWWGDSELAG